jgi:hypothetical protein
MSVILQGPVSLDTGLLESNSGSTNFEEICCLDLRGFKVHEQSHSGFSSKDIKATSDQWQWDRKAGKPQKRMVVGLGVDVGDTLQSIIKWM